MFLEYSIIRNVVKFALVGTIQHIYAQIAMLTQEVGFTALNMVKDDKAWDVA